MNDDDIWIEDEAPLVTPPAERPNRAREAAPVTAEVALRIQDRAPTSDRSFVALPERVSLWWDRLLDRAATDPGRAFEAAVSVLVVALGTAIVFATLHPSLLFQNTTPTGGDMGAHVWGPNYLRHDLLPNLRLSGWTHDWYDGFPAYQFYMVVPSLLIVILNVGLSPLLAVPVVVASALAVLAAWSNERLYRYRRIIAPVAAAVAVLSVPIPYNISFKVVTAVGLLAMPLVCWAFAKLCDLPFPIPPIMSAAGLIFVFNREPIYNNTGNIIGGNFHSTMAGEFAFSISLTLAILYLGVAVRGLRTGRHRALAAGLFALASLCHLIPAFFVLACTVALFLLHPDRARLKWLATMAPVAGALTAFWILPFWWRRDYVNDMGWERLPIPNANISGAAQRITGDQQSIAYYLFPQGLRYLIVAAAVGVVISAIRRYRVGLVLGFAWVAVDLAFWLMPQYRLWNARLLPFMYLTVSLLAAIAAGELIRLAEIVAAGGPQRRFRPITVPAALLVALGTLLYVVMPLPGIGEFSLGLGGHQMVGIDRVAITRDTINDSGTKTTETIDESQFRLFGRTIFRGRDTNGVGGWAAWNYSGLEGKKQNCTGVDMQNCTGGWPEYHDFMATMARIGNDPRYGCGRAFWEYDNDRINTYGTPMAPMLLPYWTDGCIASQEGLYFESTPTVPVHFLMQSELSAKPSRPQRDLPYPAFDMDAGVRHLQLLGVRYYVAMSDIAVVAADANPNLKQIAVTGPWHVYLVADSPEVSPLRYEPVVATGIGESQDEFLPTETAWLLGGDLDVPIAVHGPDEWKRVAAKPVPTDLRRLSRWILDQLGRTGPMDPVPEQPRTRLPDNKVTNIAHDESTISFDVSKPGVPVLVKTSYFPNWTVEGGKGPYRVTPNLMVVVPTSKHVTLRYARTPPDLLGLALTILGLIGLVWLARSKPVDVPHLGPGRLSRWIDEALTIAPQATAPTGDDVTGTWDPGDPTVTDENPHSGAEP
ncbi:MAG: hypothetical protein KDB02_15610 [Acidimicrobiales bacterium]|nr:hypothetical protein [Acidimicrobiales bacterium]